MPVKITYMSAPIASNALPDALRYQSIGPAVRAETLSVPATGTYTAQNGEIAYIVSTESAVVIAAHGSAPDAAATTGIATTSAGYAIPPGMPITVALRAGDKIDLKAFA
jgi:hypothetical protein